MQTTRALTTLCLLEMSAAARPHTITGKARNRPSESDKRVTLALKKSAMEKSVEN